MIASVFSSIFSGPAEWAVGGLIIILITWVTKKYLIPFLDTEVKKKMAEYILLIADEVTDQLVEKYPDKDVLKYLDRTVDKIMEICDVKKREVAIRAAEASFARKGIKAKD